MTSATVTSSKPRSRNSRAAASRIRARCSATCSLLTFTCAPPNRLTLYMTNIMIVIMMSIINRSDVMNSQPATVRQSARSMRGLWAVTAVLAVMMAVAGGQASAAADEAAARAFFTKFVAAQNAHDVNEVKSMLWDAPDMLWFGRNVETRGRDAVADRF